MRPPGQCNSQRLKQRLALRPGRGAGRGRDGLKSPARCTGRLRRGGKKAAAGRIDHGLLRRTDGRRAAEDDLAPLARILGQHDIGSHRLDESRPPRALQSGRQTARRASPDLLRDICWTDSFCQVRSCASSKCAGARPRCAGSNARAIGGEIQQAVSRGGVPEPEQVVAERGGGEALFAIFAHRGRAMALG